MSTTTWDIETGPEADEIVLQFTKPFAAYVEPEAFDPKKVKVGNRKDPVAIEQYIADAKVKHAEAALSAKAEYDAKRAEYYQKAIEYAALSPLTGRILAIGLLYADGTEEILTAENNEQEKAIITRFLSVYSEHLAGSNQLVGFNTGANFGGGFDLSFVSRRAMKYGIDASALRSNRGWGSSFVDLLDVWRCGDRTLYVDLDTLCRFFGLDGKKGGDGAQFARLFREDRAAAISYLRNDLVETQRLAKKMLVFVPDVAADEPSFLAA
jgi:hypothetical protein